MDWEEEVLDESLKKRGRGMKDRVDKSMGIVTQDPVTVVTLIAEAF
jgi:hypothetical protein